MHRIMNSQFRLAAVFAWMMLVCLPAHSAVEKNSAAAQAMSWESTLLGKSISCAVHLPDSDVEKNPVVVYLKNLPTPRLGELDDKTLIKGFLDQGMVVIEADYENDPRAAAPELLPEIDRWYGYLYQTKEHPVDKDWIYIVPAGYAIDRKIEICKVLGKGVGMDVIYPSGQSDPVPLMLQITSTKDAGKWINQRAYYIYGLLTTGYAGAIMDYNGGQRVSPVGRVFPEKQAARLLRANAKRWNLSGKLGVTGHSKGSSRAAKAAFVNEAQFEDDPGPHAEQSARFQVVLASAGQHAKEFLIEDGYLDEVGEAKRQSALRQQKEEPIEEIRINSTNAYVTADDPPAFLCVGELDKKFRVAQMKRLAAQCEKVGLEHRLIVQKGMDHMYIPDPEVIGEIFSFFDKYLKTEALPVTRVTFYSQSVARELVFNIILPAGYEDSGKRYPALYLLHGRGGGLEYWPAKGVAEYVAKYDLIVVMPDVGVSWYVNWAESAGEEKNDWEDCITKDLIGFVDAHYRTVASREGRAISGASMGGYGALTLGFLHPDLFCSVNSHSAALRITDRWRERLENIWAEPVAPGNSSTPDQEIEKEHAASLAGYEPKGRIVTNTDQIDALDPYKLVLAVPREQLPDIRINCGIDESLGEFSQRLAKLLMEHKIAFTFSQAPGRHNAELHTRMVKQSIPHQYAVMMNQLGGALPDDPGSPASFCAEETAQGWVAGPDVVERYIARDTDKNFYSGAPADIKIIYREEDIPPYTLPDALKMNDGSIVTDAETWKNRRRPEILELFRAHVHGREPVGRPEGMKFELGPVDREALEGKATQKDLAINFTGKASGQRMDMRVFTPNGTIRPVPCFLYLGRSFSSPQSRFEGILPEIMSRGYGLAVIDREGIDPDDYDEFKNGVHGAFDPPGERPGDAWGTVAAWAWGLSRALDYLETDKDVDSSHVAVMGVSRAGKTALWAGAQDERFAMTISVCSGCTGAALSRRRFGNPINVLNGRNPHWYCENYKQYGGNEDALPIDQHMLLSLIAPRLLYVNSADTDLWADPRGEFLGAKHAEPVYHLLGVKGLEAKHMPAIESPVQIGRIGYHIRTGGHGLEEYDWLRYLDFADKHWKGE